jgi:peptidoglycan/xylan/chitin deacetylase (PgdA/CDA1 family)
VVALTYDDGPHPIYTPQLLDILDRYNVKATFFMVGKSMEEYPDIVRDAVKRGHVIGNHTFTHPHNIELDTQAQMIRELDSCEQVIERLTGGRAHLFRPPRGLVDGSVFTIANEEGYKTILWTVCADHHDAPTPELMAQRVLRHARPGAIILAHDGSFPTRWKDVAATPLLIEGLRKRGYRFVTVPQLLKMR